MSVAQLVKQIHQLTYTEMQEVAASISTAIMMYETKRSPGTPVQGPAYQDVAQALLDLKAKIDIMGQEQQLLREIFGKRKRAITITPLSPSPNTCHFTVEVSGTQNSVATGPDLRACLNQLLDQVITLQALQK